MKTKKTKNSWMLKEEARRKADAAFRAQGPVRRGAVYCSPWCGYNCTHAAYLEAHRKAKALCAKLGKGWTPVVHENLGWHYRATFMDGRLNMHEHHDKSGTSYMVFVHDEPNSLGGRFTADGRTPNVALRGAMSRIINEISEWQVMELAVGNARRALPKVARPKVARLRG